MATVIKYLWVGMALWTLCWVPIAYFVDKTLLAGQMLEQFHTSKAIPLVVDLFVVADILWLPLLVRLMVDENGDQWTKGEALLWSLIGLGASFAFHYGVVLKGNWPAVLGWKGGTTWVGWMHIPYFAAGIAITGLFCSRLGGDMPFIHPRSVPVDVGLYVGLGFLVQFILDLHVPMLYMQRWLKLSWYPDVFASDPRQFWMLAGAFVLAALGTLATAGLLPFLATLAAAMALIVGILIF